ncbi:MAG: hypothetical protein FJ096_06040 [Deltaproteobacteria bacterium]|nr:hypothetical protein [Deltaproteobacteria bacterium]
MSDEKNDDTLATPEAEPRARRVRRTSKVDREPSASEVTSTTSEADGDSAAAPGASTRPAPVRSTPERSTPERSTPARPRRSPRPVVEGASGADREGAPRSGRRAPRAPEARPRRTERKPTAPQAGATPLLSALAGSRSKKKTIYRQDVVGTPPEMPKVEAKRSPDQLALVWHPAPKATAPAVKREVKPMTAKEALKAKLAKQQAQPRKDESPRHQDAKPTAAGTLDPAWIAADADTALDAARAAGEAGEALVKAWLDASNAAAIVRLSSLDHAPGKARKAARRALNVLKARGVSVEAAPVVLARPVVSEDTAECLASFIPPDGNGTTFFSFSQRLPGGRFRVADIMVNETSGVVHATLGHLAGKHIRRWRERVEQSFGLPPIPVPLDWARSSVAEGRKRNDASKQIVPLGYDGCLVLAGPTPAAAIAHPVADLAAREPSKEDLATALVDSDKLHNEPEFAAWVVERGALSELVSKVGERLTGADVEDRALVDRTLEEETAAATDRWFTPERRSFVATRLQDAAIALRARRGDDAARRAIVLAEAVRRAGLVTDPPRDIPFLRAFFQKGVAWMARENQGRLPMPARPVAIG